MKPESLARFEFPDGDAWTEAPDADAGARLAGRAAVGGGA
jgi:hypothetical protein